MDKQNNQVSKFVEKHSQLLKSEGFEEVVNVGNKIRFKRGSIVIDLSSVKDKDMIQVITRMPNRLKYTTLISVSDPTGVFKKVIRRFHEHESYRKSE